MGQTITDVKLVKKGKSLVIAIMEDGECPAWDEKTGSNACHPDLINTLQKLAPHLAILSDFFTVKKPPVNADDLKRFFVTGYALGGKEGFEGITLKGYRSNIWGGITLLNPFVVWESTPENTYPLIEQVRKIKEQAEKEVVLYFKEAKRGDPELFGGSSSTQDSGDQDDDDMYYEKNQEKEKEPVKTRKPRKSKAEKQQEGGAKVVEHSAYPNISRADADAMERVKAEDKENPATGRTATS